ncbi:MAG: SlyX family protein [Pseudomonadota bacterium]|nr:SlyX family protein [Pseudomonadales bacterium]MEE3289904.1 SlyX family protein [Pseudomonadota bacterium]
MEEKLIELETKYSFQEDLLQNLNEAIVKQQRELERLGDEIKHLQNQLLDLAENSLGNTGAEIEKPPHY